MADAGSSFTAQVSAWVAQTRERTEAVFRESAQRVIEDMQTPVGAGGNMPIVTGFLRASLRAVNARVDSMPAIRPKGGGAVTSDEGAVAAVIANAKLGSTITAIYLAAYAMRVNYGFVGKDSLGRAYNQRGRLFVQKAAQRWPSIVAAASADLKGSTRGGGR